MADSIYEKQKEVYPTAIAQQTLQQQQIAAQMGMRGMEMHQQMQENQAILVEQTNPSKLIDELILQLQGKRKLPDGSIQQVLKEPLLNEYGIERAWFYASTIVNQGTTLSHLEEGEAGNLIVPYANDLGDELAMDWKKWGIKDKSWLGSIKKAITYRCFFALRRAEGQNEKNWLGKISFENLSNAPSISKPKKESWLSKFKI